MINTIPINKINRDEIYQGIEDISGDMTNKQKKKKDKEKEKLLTNAPPSTLVPLGQDSYSTLPSTLVPSTTLVPSPVVPSSTIVYPLDTSEQSVPPGPVSPEMTTIKMNDEPNVQQSQFDNSFMPYTNSLPIPNVSKTEEKATMTSTIAYSTILDPLSVIVKLAMLGKKPINTKVTIYNNALCIQETGIFQGLVRRFGKSSKLDLHLLYTPIEQACIHYLKPTTHIDMIQMRYLFQNAIVGIQMLRETYLVNTSDSWRDYSDNAMVVLCLNIFIDIIQQSLLGTYQKSTIQKHHNMDYYSEDVLQKMFDVWTIDRLQIVLKLNEYVYKASGAITSSLDSLETFMGTVDTQIRALF